VSEDYSDIGNVRLYKVNVFSYRLTFTLLIRLPPPTTKINLRLYYSEVLRLILG
jgi:hypothetical protein